MACLYKKVDGYKLAHLKFEWSVTITYNVPLFVISWVCSGE